MFGETNFETPFSMMFYCHYLGKWSDLTNVFQIGWNQKVGPGTYMIIIPYTIISTFKGVQGCQFTSLPKFFPGNWVVFNRDFHRELWQGLAGLVICLSQAEEAAEIGGLQWAQPGMELHSMHEFGVWLDEQHLVVKTFMVFLWAIVVLIVLQFLNFGKWWGLYWIVGFEWIYSSQIGIG